MGSQHHTSQHHTTHRISHQSTSHQSISHQSTHHTSQHITPVNITPVNITPLNVYHTSQQLKMDRENGESSSDFLARLLMMGKITVDTENKTLANTPQPAS